MLWGTAYRPVRRLGRGGMGEVIEAEHVGLGKPVVVKLLHRDLDREPRVVERMRIEAQALARLAHPNLVVVTDFGQTPEGRTYIAMERLYGRTFREELAARGALPALEALDLVGQALAGLAAAHGAGIVHRDVKLENLFVCDPDPHGRRVVKVLDFGLAKVVAPAGDRRAPAPSRYPTEEGVLLGTPRYLSPEQARGLAVDARTDVYAAGVVLYTLLAGRGPFEHVEPLLDLLRAHVSEVPEPPSRHAPGPIPLDLDRAVMKALEKCPDLRFPDAARFGAELARIVEDAPAGFAGPSRWQTTELLAVPPVVARLDPTLKATARAFGFGAPPGRASRASGEDAASPRRAGTVEPARRSTPHGGERHSGVFVALLVVIALLCGFAFAALTGVGG
jgi:eukaryotic-like serine/threonine-protein kinase